MASGGSKLAKAVQYAKNEKKYLFKYLEDPIIPVDNNLAERAVKPFVIHTLQQFFPLRFPLMAAVFKIR